MTRCKSGTPLSLGYSEGDSIHQLDARMKYHRNSSSIILLLLLQLPTQSAMSGSKNTAKSSLIKITLRFTPPDSIHKNGLSQQKQVTCHLHLTMAPTFHTLPSESVPNVDNKDTGESYAQTSHPNQNPLLANAPSAKDTTKPLGANSERN